MSDEPEADGSQKEDRGRGGHAPGDAKHAGKTRTDGWTDDTQLQPKAEKRHRALGIVATFLIILISTGVGSLIINVPPSLPVDFPGFVISLGGAVLLTIAAVVATLFDKIWRLLSIVFVNLPGRAKEMLRDRPIRPFVFIASLAVAILIAELIPKVPVTMLEPGGIILLSAFDQSPSDPRRILINQWNQAHPLNRVEVVEASGLPDEQHDRMVNEAKGSHEADIYLLDGTWMSEFIKNDYIIPLDESLRESRDEDFFSNVLATCRDTYGGKPGLWGLPLNTDAGLIFYQSGIRRPASWDDYFGDAARAAMLETKSLPRNRPQFANAAQFEPAEILTVTALEAIWAAGGRVVNEDGKPVLNADRSAVDFDDQAKAGLKRLATAYVDRDITAPDANNDGETNALTRFKSGQALYMRNWPVTYDRLRSSRDKASVPFEVSALPNRSVLGGQNLAISRSTKRPRAAQAFMEFLTSPSSQLIIFDVGGFAPSRPSAYVDASSITRPYAEELRSAVERARPRPVTPNYVKFSKEFRLGIQRALNNHGHYEADFPEKLAALLR